MIKTIISLKSITYAVKARRIFERNGISCRLVKLEENSSYEGCTHGLKINNKDFLNAIMLLKEHSIDYKIYTKKA